MKWCSRPARVVQFCQARGAVGAIFAFTGRGNTIADDRMVSEVLEERVA